MKFQKKFFVILYVCLLLVSDPQIVRHTPSEISRFQTVGMIPRRYSQRAHSSLWI